MVGDIGSSLPALAAAAVVLDDVTVLASRDDVSAPKLSTAGATVAAANLAGLLIGLPGGAGGAILAEMAASTTTAIVLTT